MSDFIVGMVSIIVVAIVIALVGLAVKKKLGRNSCQYDERQKLVRGKGYQISFMTVLLLNIFYACFFYGLTKDIISPQLVVMTIAFIGIMIYCVYCIFHDAYLQVGQNYGYGKWAALTTLVILVNGIAAFSNRGQGFIINGFATGFSMNLMIALTFLVVLLSIIIKAAMDRKGAANEES